MKLSQMRKSARLLKDMKRHYDHALTALGVGDIGRLKGEIRNMMVIGDELYLDTISKKRESDI